MQEREQYASGEGEREEGGGALDSGPLELANQGSRPHIGGGHHEADCCQHERFRRKGL